MVLVSQCSPVPPMTHLASIFVGRCQAPCFHAKLTPRQVNHSFTCCPCFGQLGSGASSEGLRKPCCQPTYSVKVSLSVQLRWRRPCWCSAPAAHPQQQQRHLLPWPWRCQGILAGALPRTRCRRLASQQAQHSSSSSSGRAGRRPRCLPSPSGSLLAPGTPYRPWRAALQALPGMGERSGVGPPWLLPRLRVLQAQETLLLGRAVARRGLWGGRPLLGLLHAKRSSHSMPSSRLSVRSSSSSQLPRRTSPALAQQGIASSRGPLPQPLLGLSRLSSSRHSSGSRRALSQPIRPSSHLLPSSQG